MVYEKNTHAMTLVVVLKRTHMQRHWWIHVVYEKNTHAMTLVVVYEKNTHALTLVEV